MVDKNKLGGIYEFNFDVNSDTIALIYLSERYKLDLLSLLLLYEKFGRDVLYFFFLLSGRAMTFPKASKLLRVLEFCESVHKNITEDKPIQFSNTEYKSVFERIKAKLKGKMFSHCIRVYNNESGEINFRFDDTSRFSGQGVPEDESGDVEDVEYSRPEEPDDFADREDD